MDHSEARGFIPASHVDAAVVGIWEFNQCLEDLFVYLRLSFKQMSKSFIKTEVSKCGDVEEVNQQNSMKD